MAGWRRAIVIEFLPDKQINNEALAKAILHGFASTRFAQSHKLSFWKSEVIKDEVVEGRKEFEIHVNHDLSKTDLALKFYCFISIEHKRPKTVSIVGDTTDSDHYLSKNHREIVMNIPMSVKKDIRLAVYDGDYDLESVEELLSSGYVEVLIKK